MSASKEATEISNQLWSMGDQIEELRGKFLLKKKDSDAYRESSKNEIRQNEKAIGNLRHSNRAKRITLAQDENGDERVIKTVFKSDRTEKLSLQRNTASGAISEMDQKVCEGGKLLNQLRFEREKREKKLEEMQVMYDRMLRLGEKSPEQEDEQRTVTRVENDLDKALIKYDTARIISRRYQEILDTLKEESLTQPARLDAMEQALRQQKNELKELKVMAQDAMQGRDAAKQQLSKVEQAAYEARRRRDKELTATRKEVERRKEQAEKNERRAVHIRVANANDNSDHKQFLKQQQKRENQKRILSYEEAYQEIREATYVTDIHDVIGCVQKQRETYNHLQSQVRTMEAEREKLTKEKERLMEEHHKKKFYGAAKQERGQQLINKMHAVLTEDEATRESASSNSKRLGDVLLQVKTGVSALLDKLVDVPTTEKVEAGDVFEEVSICSQKLKALKEDIESARQYSDMNVGVTHENFQDFLETKMPADKTRIKVEESSMELAEFDLDSQENDETLNRTDIKLMGQRLLDTKGKKGRKK